MSGAYIIRLSNHKNYNQQKLRDYFTLKIPSQGLWSSPFPNFDRPVGNSFSF